MELRSECPAVRGITPVIALLAVAVGGCIEPLGTETSPIGRVERDCLVPPASSVDPLGAPTALEYPGRSLWTWESAHLDDGRLVEAPYAVVESAAEACAHGPELVVGLDARPRSLLSLTEAERAENEVRTDGRRLALVPRGGFVHLDFGYLFYDHVLRGPGILDEENLGTGLCVLVDGPQEACRRVGLPDDTRLFDATRRVLNHGGLVANEHALVYGCRSVATLQAVCTVTGAPLDALTDPAAYRLHDDFDGWQSELDRGTNIVDELGRITVAPFKGGYLMTALDIFESRIYLRHAATPFGPFTRRVAAFDLLPTRAGFPGGGREHAGLRDDPQTIHVTYSTDDPRAAGLHLVTYRVFGEFWR